MITVFLCDDDSETVEKYSKLIKQIADKYQIEISLSTFYSGESLVFHLSDNSCLPDIIYLDILMENLDGIDVARKLRDLGCKAEIIFLSTSEDYVFDAFDVHPLHYLRKHETSEEKFEEIFLRAVKLSSVTTSDKFVYTTISGRKVIPLKDISHFVIWKGVITVHYGKGEKFEYWSTLKELSKQLQGKGFVRMHRSYIVNLQYISEFRRREVILKTGKIIPIGVTYEENAKKAFRNYVELNSTFF